MRSVNPIIQLWMNTFWKMVEETTCIVSLNVIRCPGGTSLSSTHDTLRPNPATLITKRVSWGTGHHVRRSIGGERRVIPAA